MFFDPAIPKIIFLAVLAIFRACQLRHARARTMDGQSGFSHILAAW
jgi:hypothetical protein